ncbi:MAG: hypothetical protein OEY14_09305, partial [Myxococcales bacterium]|nr:hypothetical protein [Myxococcales bacterium]
MLVATHAGEQPRLEAELEAWLRALSALLPGPWIDDRPGQLEIPGDARGEGWRPPPHPRASTAPREGRAWARHPSRSLLRFQALTLLIALLSASAIAGCPTPPPTTTLPLLTTEDPDAEVDLSEARGAAERGEDGEAERRYRLFLEEHPSDPLVAIAELGLGRLLLASLRLEEAGELFAHVAAHTDPAVAERGQLYGGVTLHLRGEHAQALQALHPLQGRLVDPEETALVLRTMAAAALALGDRGGAARALDALLEAGAPESERHDAELELIRIIDEEASEENLLELYGSLPRAGRGWPQVARRRLREAFASGRMVRVREIVSDLREAGVHLDEELRALAMRAERSAEVDPRVVGVILPLTGRGREVG